MFSSVEMIVTYLRGQVSLATVRNSELFFGAFYEDDMLAFLKSYYLVHTYCTETWLSHDGVKWIGALL
jgi:hypothetical protein